MAALIWRAQVIGSTRPTPVPSPGKATVFTAVAIGSPTSGPSRNMPCFTNSSAARAARNGFTVSRRIIGTRIVGGNQEWNAGVPGGDDFRVTHEQLAVMPFPDEPL